MANSSRRALADFAGLLLLLFPVIGFSQDEISSAALQHANKLLRSTPLIDGHNDLPWLHREETGGDVAAFRLDERLVERGWGDKDLRQLAGGNMLRVMRTVETVSRDLQKESALSNTRKSQSSRRAILPILSRSFE